MNKSSSISKLAAALVAAQAEMPIVTMNAQNPFLKNKYADLGAVIATSRPVLAKNKLSVSQFPVTGGEGYIGVTSILMHESGEWIEETVSIPMTDSKGLSVAQSAGVVISYLRRYSWASILGLYADEDNDGHTGEEKSIDKKPKEPKSNRQSMTERYAELTKEARELELEVHPLNPKMTDDEIIEAGRELKERISKAKEGK
jgi:hypothetical protein